MFNQQKLFNDSTYGSYSGFLGSNSNCSSYAMSLSDSEFPEEPPSTSGCSSDFANSSHQREKKKEKLKQYLKQLRQMVAPQSNIGGQLSTIGALKHVLESMQKNKNGSHKTEETQQRMRITSPFSSTSESEDDMKFLSLKSQDELQILVSTRGLKIVQVTPNLKKILGYPMDSWTGRDLTSFLHRKDVVTVNSSYVNDEIDRFDSPSMKFEENGEPNPENPKRVIYYRLRHYKGLRKGFSLENKDQYTSFQASVSVKTSSRAKEANTGNLKQYVLFECKPLTSAYKNWAEIANDKKVFSTRHSLFCSYTYIHPNAIQLLGFLPQDMVGMSIFDFYHPEDFEQLYSIYKQVVTSKAVTVSSPEIRFRTYNGDWIYVKTEWSRFINPWSKRLEFIIGQHTVTKGPKNIDVLSQPIRQECIAEESDQYLKNLRLIRKLLLQPVVDEARSIAHNIIDDEPEDVSVSLTPEKEGSGDTTDESRKKVQALRGDIRPLVDENSSGMYEQLNYTNNIKRFLLSQPKTYSSASDKRSGSYTDDNNAIDSDEVPDFEVDIPLPKARSFCSSTKVLVSEKEDMVPSPSCQIEELGEEIPREAQCVDPTPEPRNVLLSLTQETLLQHTKRQEKMFLQQAKQDKNFVLLNVTSKYSVMQESSHGLKRVHSPDIDEIRKVKSFKTEEASFLHPPFPISTRNNICKPRNESPKIALSDLYRLAPSTVYHTGGMPVVQIVPNKMPYPAPVPTPMSTSGMKPENVQWPFYPQSGIPFLSGVMGGFYQPMTVLSYSKPSTSQGIFTQAGNRGQTSMSISDTSSQENTSSSFMYLLELSNNSEVDGTKKKKNVPQKMQRVNQRHVEPPWLFGVLWNEVVQMRYTMPRRKFNRVMKEDCDRLKIMKQSDKVLSQMQQCKEDVEKAEDTTTLDEEADYLFMIEPDVFKDDSSDDSRELNDELQAKIKFPTVIESNISDNVSSESSSLNKLERLADSHQDSSSSDNDQMDVQEKKSDSECDFLQKSSFIDSLIDAESTYSKSSDLTPSDARSTDEKGSSMKESDTQSSKLSKNSESENDLNQTKNQPENIDGNNYYNFFVKNPTKFKHSKCGFWMNEVDLNEQIQNEYTLKQKKQNDILMKDLNRLNEMKQSPVVREQLSNLLEQIGSNNQNERCTCSGKLTSDQMKCTSCQNKHSDFFENLFMQPLINEEYTCMSSEQSTLDSPDMEDLCNIFDPVD